MRFDDIKYVKDYANTGKFPKIHDTLYYLINSTVFNPACDVFDFGCCTGLLSLRLARRFAFVTGFDINTDNIKVAQAFKSEKASFINLKIDSQSIAPYLDNGQPKLIVARRVFPEISGGDPNVIRVLAEKFFLAGVKHIAIEGRVDSVKATHPLHNVKEEAKCFESFYKIVAEKKNCIILQMITD